MASMKHIGLLSLPMASSGLASCSAEVKHREASAKRVNFPDKAL